MDFFDAAHREGKAVRPVLLPSRHCIDCSALVDLIVELLVSPAQRHLQTMD